MSILADTPRSVFSTVGVPLEITLNVGAFPNPITWENGAEMQFDNGDSIDWEDTFPDRLNVDYAFDLPKAVFFGEAE